MNFYQSLFYNSIIPESKPSCLELAPTYKAECLNLIEKSLKKNKGYDKLKCRLTFSIILANYSP